MGTTPRLQADELLHVGRTGGSTVQTLGGRPIRSTHAPTGHRLRAARPAHLHGAAAVRGQFLGLVASRALGSALQAVTLVLLARSVPVALFGTVVTVTAVVGMALVVTGLGLAVYVPQARARGEGDVVRGALRGSTVSTVGTAVLLGGVVGVWAARQDAPAALVVVALALALERNVETFLGVSLGDGDSRTTAVSVVLRRGSSLLVFGSCLLLGAGPVQAYAAGSAAGALAGQVHVRRALRGRLPSGPRTPLPDVIRRSSSYLVASVSAQLRTLDVAAVALVMPADASGLYAGVSKLVQPLLLVPQSLAAVVAPRATGLSPAEARRLSGRLVAVFLGALVVGSPAIVWAEELAVLVLGPGFAGAGPALAWALGGLPLLAISSTSVAVLQGQGRARGAAANAAVFAVLLLVLVAVGGAVAGPAGAAAGLTVSYLPRVLVLLAMVRRLGR